MAPKVHPISIIVFIVGVLLAATGITLAIVFGVTNSGNSPPAPSNCNCSCDAKLFTIRTGLTSETVTWNDTLTDPNSDDFKETAAKVNTLLTAALTSPTTSGSSSAYKSNAAASSSPGYVVEVTRFMLSADGQSVVAFASGAATGDSQTIQNLPDLQDNVEISLRKDDNVTVEPAVNYDSMTFCVTPDTNINDYTGTPASNCNCPTSSPCPTEVPLSCPTPDPVTCQNVTLPCDCSTCPSTTCSPTIECATSIASDPTTCPTCPAPEVCPTANSTCPVCDASTCAPFTTTCPPSEPCPSVGSCPTPVCDASTCATVIPSCPTPKACPDVSLTCPTPMCDAITCAPFSSTCAPLEPCPSGNPPLPDATTCAPFIPTCPTSEPTCPVCEACPTDSTLVPPTGQTCPPPVVCPTLTSSETCPPCGSQSPATCPSCPVCPTLGTTVIPTTGTISQGTTTVPTTVPKSTGSTPLTTTIPPSTVTQGISTISSLPGSTITLTQGTGTPISTLSQTSGMTTEALTTEIGSTTTVKPICYGEEYYYGNLAIVFEHSDAGSRAAQDAQNIMVNTFMSLQLLKFPGYLVDSTTTRLLVAPYPDPSQYPWLTNSYSSGPRDLSGFNSTITAVDIIDPPDSPDATVKDGLEFVLNAKDQDRFSGVVIVGISSDFVNDALASAQSLKQKGSFVFTVSLNDTGDLGPLASDLAFAFNLTNPRNAGDAGKIATAIGNALVAQSPICIGGTSPTTKPPPTTTLPPTSVVMTTTTPSCPMKFITNDIAFVFENAYDPQGTFVQSNLTASFLSNFLIAKAMSDLNGSGSWSTISSFALVGFPHPEDYFNLWSCCNFGKVDQQSYSFQLATMNIAAAGFPELAISTATSLNDGLNYANNEYSALNDGRQLSIVLLANSDIGVASATNTATALRQNGNAVVTVAVGGNFDLSPLATPSAVHYLTSSSDQANLAQAIVSDLANQGSRCCYNATQCL